MKQFFLLLALLMVSNISGHSIDSQEQSRMLMTESTSGKGSSGKGSSGKGSSGKGSGKGKSSKKSSKKSGGKGESTIKFQARKKQKNRLSKTFSFLNFRI